MKIKLAALITTLVFAAPTFASEKLHADAAIARNFIKEMQTQNAAYIKAHNPEFFAHKAKGQQPRATVVSCSDSRVHTGMLDDTPEGDVFMIRNIGNQLASTKGSVQYGINHLGSSLLLFIGHSSCGAIKAAGGDYSSLEAPIKKELDTINITKGSANIDGVKTNVHNQVAAALKEWDSKVKSGELLIVGAVYDFSDDMKQGAGKLNVVNINGETDVSKLGNAPAAAAQAGEQHHDHQH